MAVLPRVSTPTLAPHEINQLEVSDLFKFSVRLVAVPVGVVTVVLDVEVREVEHLAGRGLRDVLADVPGRGVLVLGHPRVQRLDPLGSVPATLARRLEPDLREGERLAVRGAPAIGIAGAYGLWLGAKASPAAEPEEPPTSMSRMPIPLLASCSESWSIVLNPAVRSVTD